MTSFQVKFSILTPPPQVLKEVGISKRDFMEMIQKNQREVLSRIQRITQNAGVFRHWRMLADSKIRSIPRVEATWYPFEGKVRNLASNEPTWPRNVTAALCSFINHMDVSGSEDAALFPLFMKWKHGVKVNNTDSQYAEAPAHQLALNIRVTFPSRTKLKSRV